MYSEYTLPEAKKARAHGIHMFGVGIGLTSSDARELNEIVSRPSEQNAFINGDFSHMKNVSDKILSALCQGKFRLSARATGVHWIFQPIKT